MDSTSEPRVTRAVVFGFSRVTEMVCGSVIVMPSMLLALPSLYAWPPFTPMAGTRESPA
ncbi:hypothetical protein D3C75_1108220 [compost metagenome]